MSSILMEIFHRNFHWKTMTTYFHISAFPLPFSNFLVGLSIHYINITFIYIYIYIYQIFLKKRISKLERKTYNIYYSKVKKN
jgi:hypothetical protein